MTKRELLSLIKGVPMGAEIFIECDEGVSSAHSVDVSKDQTAVIISYERV